MEFVLLQTLHLPMVKGEKGSEKRSDRRHTDEDRRQTDEARLH